MIRRFLYLVFIASGIVLLSCNGTTTESDGFSAGDDFAIPDSVLDDEEPLIVSEEAMEGIISNISSPVEMAALIKSSGIQFNYKYLSPADNVDSYNTAFKQALNLGILGADLGYLNMYNESGSVISYITSIKSLSDELQIGHFFDFNTLKKLATNSDNLDSLMYISVSSFDQMDVYLRENNRSDISALIVTGVWLEGIFLATQVIKESPMPEITERIGEQKIILNDLMLILKNYKKDKKFFELIEKIEFIKEQYSDVTITYEVGEPEMVEVDGVLTIIQNEKSIVNITDEQLQNISNAVAEVRQFVIN